MKKVRFNNNIEYIEENNNSSYILDYNSARFVPSLNSFDEKYDYNDLEIKEEIIKDVYIKFILKYQYLNTFENNFLIYDLCKLVVSKLPEYYDKDIQYYFNFILVYMKN